MMESRPVLLIKGAEYLVYVSSAHEETILCYCTSGRTVKNLLQTDEDVATRCSSYSEEGKATRM